MSRNTKVKNAPSVARDVKVSQRVTPERMTAQRERPDLDAKIAWNFKRMDSGGKFKCSLELLHDHAAELIKLEGIKIADVMARSHNHPTSVKKLSKEAKDRITAMNLDIETLHQLNLKTPARLWGILERNIFHIIWLDPDHKVYLSK